ncbi:MAG: hypothetical protein NTX50_18905 [Candidatus Sumerlaeota bacterium]|nr:hypothetical protein [Candidatus Sumerlaeota bacterium]
MNRSIGFLHSWAGFFMLLALTAIGQPPGVSAADPQTLPTRSPSDVLLSIGCWFWTDAEFQPEGYRPFLDTVSSHAAFNLLTTSLRVQGREVTDAATHDQIAKAADYARRRDMKLVMDLDVRLARRAFQRAYPDELQEMLRLREIPLSDAGEVTLAIAADTLSDHYTARTTPYLPVAGRLVRVYAYRKAGAGIEPDSIEDITTRCQKVTVTTQSVRVTIPCDAATRGRYATVLAAFAHLTPDVFAPHLLEFQRAILRQYADAPLAGACKDEWGFPPCFDGCPAKNDFWFSRPHADAYAQHTGGRDLARDCLLMWLGERGHERERQAAINHYQQLAWQRNAAVEGDFYRAVKEVFGPGGVVATHPTWWPNPDLREFKKNGLDWWAVPRDLAQTDEVTPFAVRTALAKKWGGAVWINMFYAPSVAQYERAVWSHALGGGRINYHPVYPAAQGVRLEQTAALLRGGLMRAEARLRLLNFISRAPLDCPVAVIFGHAGAMNWAGPAYNDVGLQLAGDFWRQGYPADLIPADEIQSGALRLNDDGRLQYGPQRYTAAVLYHPEFEPAETASFLARAARGKTVLWRVGDWTRDFDARPFTPEWPAQVRACSDTAECAAQVTALLRERGVAPQTPATDVIGWDVKTPAPPRTGSCRMIDGTVAMLAGAQQVSGDPLHFNQPVNGCPVEANAIGVLAVRLDAAGQLEALAAGGLSLFRGGGLELALDSPLDVALWRDAQGQWRGVAQDGGAALPPALLKVTANWLRLAAPAPLPRQ